MPQVGERRPIMGVRVSAAGRDHIDERAREEGLLTPKGEPNRSEMARLMLAFASAKMPKGWRPKDEEDALASKAKPEAAVQAEPEPKPRKRAARKGAAK